MFARDLFRPADFGGNRYPWEVTRRLAERHRVRVITPLLGGPLPGRSSFELIHYPVSRRTPFETFFTNALFSRLCVGREIRRRTPDLVVISSYDVAFGHYAIRPAPIPTVYIYHSSFYSPAVDRVARKTSPLRLAHRPLAAFLRAVERLTFRSADAVVAVSPFSRREIVARAGIASDRVHLIPTGVDTGIFSPGDRTEARHRLGLPLSGTLLLTVGRLAPVKRYDRAIDALEIIRRDDPSCRLVILGIGPEDATLRAHVRGRGLAEAVTFGGFADGDRLRDHYRAADLVLCTSDFENWSLALLEALATGTPAVGTPRGGIPDILGPVDPRLVAGGVSPSDIAAAAARLLRDDDERERIAALGRQHVVATFSWDRVVRELEELFERVARVRSSATGAPHSAA